MKRTAAFLALLAFFFAGLAFANTGTLTSITGTVSAQTGTEPARALRQGDVVRQGDTVITGAASAAVIRFEDGQVTALTANSRMQITAYQYNPQTQSGNVLLSLIDGGMRAITGLIGSRTPNNVSYRAATATIGIRGTDITIVTSGGNIVVTVTAGSITFQSVDSSGRRIGTATTVTQGNGVATVNGQTFSGPAAAIVANLPAAVAASVNSVAAQLLTSALATAINTAQATGTSSSTQTIAVVNSAVNNASGAGLAGYEANCSVSGTNSVCSCPVVSNATYQIEVVGGTAYCRYTCINRGGGGAKVTAAVVAATNDACASGG